jgi:hypothetical protein
MTVTVMLLVPDAVGLPEIWPEEALIVRPAGNPVADQAYGVVPPLAATGAEYATPTIAVASEEVVIASTGLMVSESVFETLE